jgi:hypothetical protein
MSWFHWHLWWFIFHEFKAFVNLHFKDDVTLPVSLSYWLSKNAPEVRWKCILRLLKFGLIIFKKIKLFAKCMWMGSFNWMCTGLFVHTHKCRASGQPIYLWWCYNMNMMSLLYKLFNCLLSALTALSRLPYRFLVYTYSQYVRAADGISTHF